ncbi:Glutamate receptor ionotropic, kainate 2 [Toxocara canis]|uniref:Glutamate receptor ionotropic, kainate 2 n=1 Tax=Toxocara canis TaxID=6265 RepID=A0A0B2VRW9_TOXCA|nr:Glutamate receptor ionotropic, kainate 2 [Toxocara canis]
MLFIFFYHLLLATEQLVNAITTYKIGTTESIDSMHYHNLRFAIDSWNHANTIYNEVSLELIFASTTGSTVDERMCDILQRNLVAVVVSTVLSPLDSSLLQSMCLHFHVPCLTLVDNSDDENNFVTNVSPKRGLLTSAIAQLIEHLRWNTFLLIYSERRDLIELNELISGWSSTSKVRPIVKARQLPQNIEDLQPFLKYIRQLQQNNIVMHSNNISTIFSFLRQASSLNMTESRYSYIFTNPDLSLLDHFLNSADSVFQCNITGVQIVKTDPSMKTELALTMDAVDAIGAALLKLKSQELSPVATPLLCDAHDTWFDGEMMNGAIRNVSLDSGSTGKLMFTANGQRSDLFIDGMGRINGEIVKVSALVKRTDAIL